MKAVLLSSKPKYCALIASGEKTIEVRKTKPKLKPPFKCYIYQTLPKYGDWNERDGRVIGEFICNYIIGHCESSNADIAEQRACVKREDIFKYANGKEVFGWHISNLIIYDKPKDLYKFTSCHNNNDCKNCLQHSPLFLREGRCINFLKRPPRSWCYVEERSKINANL